jgi:hypothetical protein
MRRVCCFSRAIFPRSLRAKKETGNGAIMPKETSQNLDHNMVKVHYPDGTIRVVQAAEAERLRSSVLGPQLMFVPIPRG